MRTDIGIDLGTHYTRIFRYRSIALSQPSVVTLDNTTGKAIAFGDDAYKMIGRTGERITPVCPIERGTIADFESAELMLGNYLREVCGKKTVRPRAIVAIPGGTTAVQQRSVLDAVESAGARNVCLVEAPLAAAMGLGVDFSLPKGTTVVDIGKGTTDIAVLSMGGLARCESVRVGSGDFDEAIIRYIRREHSIEIGALTAEKIKIAIGCVMMRPVEVGLHMSGLNIFSGLPESFEINTTELYRAMSDTANEIVKAIQAVFEKTSPEMVADTAKDGLMLIGGGAMTYGMEQFLSERLKIKVVTQNDPLNCVVRGVGKALENFKVLKNGDYKFRSLEELTVE